MSRIRRTPLAFLTGLSAILGLIVAVTGCKVTDPTLVSLMGKSFVVEIADDRPSRMRGLMYRDQLAEDAGMLFVYEDEAPRSFWMKNTRIPLDILYLDSDFRIVSMSLDTPPCRVSDCPSYPSGEPAQYVLEVNAGTVERLGVEVGDRVEVRW